MATVDDVLKVACAEVGYSRWTDPEAGTKYGRWYAGISGSTYYGTNGVPYCAMFVSWVLAQAKATCAGIPNAYVPYIEQQAKAAKKTVAKLSARAGDIIIFDWTSDGVGDHVGIVEANKGSHLQTIEGNTSATSSGSQSNGGVVARRTRAFSVVRCVVRPNYDGATTTTTSSITTSKATSSALNVDGYWGSATTLRLQQVLGAPYKDGVISSQSSAWKGNLKACTGGWEFVGNPQGSATIKLVQQRIGATADGIMGKDSINALIKYYKAVSGASVLDGKLDEGSMTVKAMQRALNSGKF